ncbi:hypothetical protein SOV_38030 [Sporomusa ovata DSM 2662]|uniref:lasso peptide biosynthesis protein n=1 Tax=Sporomusa ovata TaxID=2378 RepID=UPI000388725F|nr:lasso peptide biosynthesis protein [Sporomusa ovata]EQB26192.1 transglutaminase-like superfamily [Sporomusa ovata DSM 2662]
MKYAQLLITGQSTIIDVPAINFILKTRILFTTLYLLRLYKKKGATEAINFFKKIQPYRKYNFSNEIQEHLFARTIVSWTQVFINLIHKEALCLERSIAICASLRYLGLQSQVIIARKATMNASLRFEFHAWVELCCLPINDVLPAKTKFTEVYRIPER